MAIPFNVPIVEQSETVLELLLVDLFEILQQIQTLQHIRAQNQIASISPRVCATPRRTRTQDVTIVPTTTTNTVNARAELDPVMPASTTVPQTSSTTTRARCCRRRTISASTSSSADNRPSYCEEIKSVVVMTDVEPRNQDWTQVGVILRKIADDFQPTTSKDQDRDKVDCKDCGSSSTGKSRSLLSKLVPRPIRSSLWTAVICVVGWHLFRAQ